ncbi:MAG TPA: DUF2797 domain-containing protein [Cryomorphaceae bacterium]|nr:DUF2797 domain-containing protein [Cryomorphaceae bacterium]
MMKAQGTLRKMKVTVNDGVHYNLNLNKEIGPEINQCLDKSLTLNWTGKINCTNCGKNLKKTFGQGFCYDCFMNAAQAAPCIIRPELCEAHLGKGRDVQWEEMHHNQPHFIYLAQTAGVKVGVTRSTNIPSRWLDQGAWRAVKIAEVPYRKLAGDLEIELKQYLSDRTDWRKMLRDERSEEDLSELRDAMISFFPEDLKQYAIPDSEVYEFTYPVGRYPHKVKSINLENEKTVEGTLTGIRGQYLYFDNENVINLRKYSGYEVEFACD